MEHTIAFSKKYIAKVWQQPQRPNLPGVVSLWCAVTVLMSVLGAPSVVYAAVMPPEAIPNSAPNASHIGQICFAAADERDLGPQDPNNDQDTLTLLNPATGEANIIGATGTHNVEALTFGPH